MSCKKSEILILILVLFAVVFSISFVTAAPELLITYCTNLSGNNTIYNLTANVQANGTCFNVSGYNITLDCRGKTVTYASTGSGYGFLNNFSDRYNVTVKNCVFTQGSAAYQNSTAIHYEAINFTQNDRQGIRNNTITTVGWNSSGIYVGDRSNCSNILNNTITTSGDHSAGIYLTGYSSNTTIAFNRVVTSGNYSVGIWVTNDMNSVADGRFNWSRLYNNSVSISGPNSSGIIIRSSSNVSLSDNMVNTSGVSGIGIHVLNSNNISMRDNAIFVSGKDADAILFAGSQYCEAIDNALNSSGGYPFYVRPSAVDLDYDHAILTNTVDGNGTYYAYSTNDIGLTANYSAFIFLAHSNFSITNGSFGFHGIVIAQTTGSKSNISGSIFTLTKNYNPAIRLDYANLTNIFNNTITMSGIQSHGLEFFNDSIHNNASYNVITVSGDGSYGASIDSSIENLLYNNTITISGDDAYGVKVNYWSNVTDLQNNTITISGANSSGVYLGFHKNTLLWNNTITTTGNDSNGITISNATWMRITGNTFSTRNGVPIALYGNGDEYTYNHNISRDNKEGGKSILYANTTVAINHNKSYAQVIVAGLNGTIINNLTLTIDGIWMVDCPNAFIANSTITINGNYTDAIYVSEQSIDITIMNNTIISYAEKGFGMYIRNNSNATTIENNTIVTNGAFADAIWLKGGNNSRIINNTINTTGTNTEGITLSDSSGDKVYNNKIKNTGTSSYVIYFERTSFNSTFYNNIFNTSYTTGTGIRYPTSVLNNSWNTTKSTTKTSIYGGSSTGGNYWARNNGNGFSETSDTCSDAGDDDVCDALYYANGEYNATVFNVDYLPLAYDVTPAAAAAATNPSAAAAGAGASTGTEAHTWGDVEAGEEAAVMDVSGEDYGVDSITLDMTAEATGVKITVDKYDDKPADVATSKSGSVYQYLQIQVSNVEGKLDKGIIRAQVRKTWLSENAIDKENVGVFKFVAGQWAVLPTSYVEGDDTYEYYTAETETFSYFAIGEVTGEEPTVTEALTPTTLTWLWIVIAVVVIVVIFFVWKKRK